jgi:hypothetical protein
MIELSSKKEQFASCRSVQLGFPVEKGMKRIVAV